MKRLLVDLVCFMVTFLLATFVFVLISPKDTSLGLISYGFITYLYGKHEKQLMDFIMEQLQ